MALSEDGVIYSWGGTLGGKGGEQVRGASEKYKPQKLPYFVNKNIRIS